VIRGVMLDFGLTLAYPPAFRDVVAEVAAARGLTTDEPTAARAARAFQR
jgi:hypothetical protein